EAVEPAGDDDGFAAHEGVVSDGGDLFGGHHEEILGALKARAAVELRAGETGAERGGSDAAAVEFDGERGRERKHERLARIIQRHIWAGLIGGGGGNVQDAAFAAGEHWFEETAGQLD